MDLMLGPALSSAASFAAPDIVSNVDFPVELDPFSAAVLSQL
jgi:hypothetical protein